MYHYIIVLLHLYFSSLIILPYVHDLPPPPLSDFQISSSLDSLAHIPSHILVSSFGCVHAPPPSLIAGLKLHTWLYSPLCSRSTLGFILVGTLDLVTTYMVSSHMGRGGNVRESELRKEHTIDCGK